MKNFLLLTSSAVLAVALAGCGSFGSALPQHHGKLSGSVWCNDRYLDMVKEYQRPEKAGNDFRKKLKLSKEGYVYAVAAALTLQKDDSDQEFNFKQPDYLKAVADLSADKWNGFQAETYIRTDPKTGKPFEAIIAFRGSDQWLIDYGLHNISPWPIQYKSAREYVQQVAAHSATQGLSIVVTGYSLGGGLAAHVTKHPDTSRFVSQAWTFNPSPRTGAPKGKDDRIHLMANQYEILGLADRSNIGAPDLNTSQSFDLVSSSSIYAHYRWVLARQVLQYADLAIYLDSGRTARTTEPQDILRSQELKACTLEEKQKIADRRAAYEKNAQAGNVQVKDVQQQL